MTTSELIRALEHMQAETGSLVCLGCGHENSCSVRGCAIIQEATKALKLTADVQPVVIGEWVGYPECLKYENAYSQDHIVCSACEECFSILDNDTERFNFCPNCGADMREEADP